MRVTGVGGSKKNYWQEIDDRRGFWGEGEGSIDLRLRKNKRGPAVILFTSGPAEAKLIVMLVGWGKKPEGKKKANSIRDLLNRAPEGH